MGKSKPIYGAVNGDNFVALMWDTPKGKILTVKGEIDPNDDIRIRDVETGEDLKDVDMRNVMLEIMGISR